MSLGRFVVGLLLAALVAGPVIAAAVRLRRRAFPGRVGAGAALIEAVAALSLLLVALELAGIVGEFDVAGVLIAGWAVAGVGWVVAGRIALEERPGTRPGITPAGHPAPSPARIASAERPASPPSAQVLAIVAAAVVAAPWLGWTIFAYGHGMETVDTLWYHMPFAARFAQLGSIIHLHYVDSQAVTVFYPANAELFHALGLVLFGADVLSPAINLGWAALALTAAWAIGSRYGRGPHCLVAVLIVLATPGMVDTQPGGAYNDIVDVALILCAAAVLLSEGLTVCGALVAAAAAGLALGTKYTMIVPALVLALGAVALSPAGSRLRHALAWVVGLVALGGFWYARNWVSVGNPLPSLSVHLGPLSFASPSGNSQTFTVGQYLTDGSVWSAYYLPGLRQSLGLAWPAVIALTLGGGAAALLAGASGGEPSRGDQRFRRLLGALALLSVVAFLFTPQFLGGPGSPVFFAVNVRYLAGALVLGLVLVPILPALRSARAGVIWMALAMVILVVTELDPGVWPTGIGVSRLADPVSGGAAIGGAVLAAALGAAALLSRRHANLVQVRFAPSRVIAATLAAAAVLIVALGGWQIAEHYMRQRYLDTPVAPAAYRWGRTVSDARIGVVGITTQYPFYGQHNSNHVQYVGVRRPHGGFAPISGCRAWRLAVDRGRYRWLVLAPLGFPSSVFVKVAPELQWTLQGSGAHLVVREVAGGLGNDTVAVVRVTGHLDPRACA